MHTFQNTKIGTPLAVILFEKKTLSRDNEHGIDGSWYYNPIEKL